jgi:hypothetical protein
VTLYAHDIWIGIAALVTITVLVMGVYFAERERKMNEAEMERKINEHVHAPAMTSEHAQPAPTNAEAVAPIDDALWEIEDAALERVHDILTRRGVVLDPDAGTETGDPAEYFAYQLMAYINGLHDERDDAVKAAHTDGLTTGMRIGYANGLAEAASVMEDAADRIHGIAAYSRSSVRPMNDGHTVTKMAEMATELADELQAALAKLTGGSHDNA